MIVTVTAYVHAFKDYTGKVVYRIDSFEQPLTKQEALVMVKEFQFGIPEEFDLDEVLRQGQTERIKQDLMFAENRVADLKKQLSGSV